jgi:predicted enzyme related to lactoylglutathione lyase
MFLISAHETHIDATECPMSERDPVTAGGDCIIPILNVRSLRESTRYYVDVLGFRVDWGDEDGSEMASVSRDEKAIMLCPGGQGHSGTWVGIGVEDIEPLVEQLHTRGAKVRQGPANFPWAYEVQIEDRDGHVLRFGSEPRTDRPFA